MQLPEAFIEQTRALMGEERFNCYLSAFGEEAPVSIRVNPKKAPSNLPRLGEALATIPHPVEEASPSRGRWEGAVPWCPTGFYLSSRPNFTFDPLFHAGCYYVQEASSMFLDEVLRQTSPDLPEGEEGLARSEYERHSPPSERLGEALDLCAAPGGKSTLLRSALPEDCVLISNEPVRNRASILLENVTKWGYRNHYVTNLYPRDFRKNLSKFFDKRSGSTGFDLILCDVPCSGEGMFRKDPATIGEWSPQNVERCWQLQRDIVSDAWACLNSGGLLIYSTCTFNTKENEENIRWILETFDAEVVPVATRPEWGITGSLLEGFHEPVYRFIPGITRGEGLFMCVIRKKTLPRPLPVRAGSDYILKQLQGHFLHAPLPHREGLGESLLPPRVDLTYQQAIAYLRREALVLPPDTPRGIVEVCFQGHALGTVKNLGNRANNLYPKEWRIKSTHVPQEYEPVLNNSSF